MASVSSKRVAVFLIFCLSLLALVVSWNIRKHALLKTYYIYLPSVAAHHSMLPKKGIGSQSGLCSEVVDIGASWVYNWYISPPICTRIESIPMIYDNHVLHALANGAVSLGGNSNRILGPNEPDRPDQANMTPYDGAVFWIQLEALYPNKLLISPAVSHEQPEWLMDFYNTFVALYNRPPRLDGGLAIHCYLNSVADCQNLIEQVIGYADMWGINEVWITEFAFLPCWGKSIDAAQDDITRFIDWMDNQPKIARYAYFPTTMHEGVPWYNECYRPLFDGGNMTKWGELYARTYYGD